jgi:hypothetical protein
MLLPAPLPLPRLLQIPRLWNGFRRTCRFLSWPTAGALLLVAAPHPLPAQPGLTIYPNGTSIVRETVPLDLKEGENLVRYSGATAQLDPSSVLLRDPAGKVPLKILEQNYRNDPITSQSLLERFENQPQTVTFLVHEPQKPDRLVEGRVIRSGYVPGGASVEPIIEVDGKLLFELPGKPLFGGLKEDNILKPQLLWKILSPAPAQFEAELAYLTGGLHWESSYNLILPESSELADLAGWVTVSNHTGKTFESARIKLLAGDLHRAPVSNLQVKRGLPLLGAAAAAPGSQVEEKPLDEYHLYTLPRPTTLRDQETKQIEFIRASGVPTRRIYRLTVSGRTPHILPLTPVQSFLEFQNNEPAKLGVPLPAGVIRVYRKDGENLELVGEDRIQHTANREKISLLLGNAFDLVGECKLVQQSTDSNRKTAEESYEVRLRNRGQKPVQIEVLEQRPPGRNWALVEKSIEPLKADANTLIFPVDVPAGGEASLRYSLRYTW